MKQAIYGIIAILLTTTAPANALGWHLPVKKRCKCIWHICDCSGGKHDLTSSTSQEPIEDYSFTCQTADSQLQVLGGVDPSGGFAVTIQGQNQWSQLNGLTYVAKRTSGRTTTKFQSPAGLTPSIAISINWNQDLSEGIYRGNVSINAANPVDFTCAVEIP